MGQDPMGFCGPLPHKIMDIMTSPRRVVGPRRCLREARGPGEGSVPFHRDIFTLIPLLAVSNLPRLYLPPELRRSQQTFLLWVREREPLTRHAPADESAGA